MITNAKFFCLDPLTQTYIAYATILDFHQNHKKHTQSQAVRQLLNWLKSQLRLLGALVEHQFPYYFIHQQQRYFVCFSHSVNHVALIISGQHAAIDIENRSISLAVAKRFYHPNEILQISLLSQPQQQSAINFLWRFKECMIKLNNQLLVSGMGNDFSSLLPQLTFDQQTQCLNLTQYTIYNNNQLALTAIYGK